MKIDKAAIAGTLESSDCMVTVMNQFGEQIQKVVRETLERLDVKDVFISIVDKGALDCTIKARVECAVYRSAGQKTDVPWGGAVR